jgi:hypothetical protein
MPGADSARTPQNVAWPEQLITQAEAFAKAADWPVYADWESLGTGVEGITITLGCSICQRSCGQLRRGHVAYNGTLDQMLSMVLRHMVMAHDVPLNTRGADNGT